MNNESNVYDRVQYYLDKSRTQFAQVPTLTQLLENIRLLEAELWTDGDIDWDDE